jgi:hypothetical protein
MPDKELGPADVRQPGRIHCFSIRVYPRQFERCAQLFELSVSQTRLWPDQASFWLPAPSSTLPHLIHSEPVRIGKSGKIGCQAASMFILPSFSLDSRNPHSLHPKLPLLWVESGANIRAAMNFPERHLAVLMPVYNEAGTVADVLRRVLAQPTVAEVVVVDDGSTDGTRAGVPLSSVAALRPPLTVRLYRYGFIERKAAAMGRDHEYALQRVEIPWGRFAAVQPGIRPERVRAVRLRFDRTPQGAIVLDDVGVSPR